MQKMPQTKMNKLISNLSGGMNIKANPIILQDSELELIINYSLNKTGSLEKRKGYDVFASQPEDDKRVVGLFQYTNVSTPAETTQVMAANDSADTNCDIYYNNGGTWTTSKTNDTAQPGTGGEDATNFTRVRFITFLDYLFRVNGVDAMASSVNVNGSVWATTNCLTTIIPAFASVFQDRIYVANDKRAGANMHGSRVYFSSLPAAGGTVTWTAADDWFDVNPDDGDEITALENNGNRLLIFKNRGLYRWDWEMVEPDRLIGVGTSSQESVKTNLDLGITFFASQNGRGIYAYTGRRPVLISRKIQPILDAVPAADWKNMAAEIDEDHYYVYLSDSITVPGLGDKGEDKTITNVMAVYTISLDAWVLYSLHSRWKFAAKLILSGAEEIYFGSHEGRTYKFNSGLEDDSGGVAENEAVRINTEAISKEYLLTYPNKTNLKYADFISKNALATLVLYQMDRGGDFGPLVSLEKRFASSRLIGKECRSIRLKFSDSGSVQSRIDGYNFEHSPLEKRK